MSTFAHMVRVWIIMVPVLGCSPRPPEGMILIPAGPFQMGSDDFGVEAVAEEAGMSKPLVLDASPMHIVDLPAYYIDQFEVRNQDYHRFVLEKGFPWLPHWDEGGPLEDQLNHPVSYVNWFEAQSYCHWKQQRLPTESEWEKAARGKDSRPYPWGSTFSQDRANVGGVQSGLQDVGSFPRGNSPFGISDAIGNVWEWTGDWYQPYPDSNYTSEDYGNQYRVIRGHSWVSMGHFPSDMQEGIVAAQGRVTYRWYLPPHAAVEDVGFRCAKSVSPSS